jgi:hypothetical protein
LPLPLISTSEIAAARDAAPPMWKVRIVSAICKQEIFSTTQQLG